MNNSCIKANIFETEAGTWKVRWRSNGKNYQQTFRLKVDALKLQAKLFGGGEKPQKTKNLFFEDFCEIWKERHCNVNIDPGTAKDYLTKLYANILPYFKGKLLAEIDEDDVIKFKEWLTTEKKFRPVTVGNQVRLLKLFFKCACRWKDEKKNRYLLSNPAEFVKEPKKPEPDFHFLTTKQIRQFLEYVRDHAPIIYEISAIAIATGMRRGELHQLQRDCLDFENRMITVKRSFSFASRQIKHTKAKRIRRIPMNEEVYQILLKFKELDLDKRVFEGIDIEHFHKHLRKWCLAAQVPIVGLHDLRDTFASSLVKSGKKIKVIQKLMGHVDISVTEKYMHLDPEDLECSTDCLLTGIAPIAPNSGGMHPENSTVQ